LQVELPANAVFAHASPRLLAAHIQNARHLKTTPINKRKPEDVVLPSMGQDLIWFLSNLEGSNAYNVPDGFIVDGPLDVEALSAALSDVVGRHEALRATLPEEDGRPIVRIQPPGPISVDVEHLSTTEDAGIRAWFTKQGLRSFDIEREIPVRAVVGALPDGRHLLSLVMHHSATDGGSAAVIYGDLTTAYHARRRGRALALPPLAIEYYDWAAWQREHLQSSETETALNAVVERLRGAPEILDLPVEFERADPSSFSGSMLHLPLPRSLERNLRASARDKQATLFMLLLAGLGVTLQRLSGQTDIVIGAPAAGRTRAEVQDTVGYFVNTVPLRLALDGAENLDEVVEIARQEVLEGFAHQELSLDRIVSALNLDRAGVRTPLFRVLLVLQPADRMTLELDDATVTPVHVDAVSARYDLTFAFEDYGDGLELVLHYANDLFSEATARRFARYFEVVLDAIASSPSTPADQVLLFGPGSSEYSDEVSGSAVVDDRGAPSGTILDRFSEIAARHGDLVALEGPDGGGLDYGALDRLTDRLADALAAAGVGRGDLVGVNMARGVEQIVLFLSILKAGGAYVPLDREQPGPRLAGMVADGGIGFVVRDDAPTGGEWLGEDIKVLSYGALAASDQQDAVWDTARNGADTAYVMFTSGSSGRPKGVQVPHRAVLRLAVEPGFASFGPGKRVAQIATTSFDAATYEIWCALLNGGTCVVVEREAAYDGASLASAFQGASGRVGVHSTFLTVSVFNRAV
ncbi:MAG: AMP-binding protein, partial [Rhodospirillaceae bacterium]|nr:AMP-binding protein [Rhodospirillaceae bacterium]